MVVTYFLTNHRVETSLVCLEASIYVIENAIATKTYPGLTNEAIDDLNDLLSREGLGYQYQRDRIIRVDSRLLHAEAIKPALQLMDKSGFEGPLEEYMTAHEHYRHGRIREALDWAGKALESVIKSIAKAQGGWGLNGKENANALIKAVFDHHLLEPMMEKHFTGIRSTLEGGVPTVRNAMGSHGQGEQVVEVPRHYAGFILHSAAAAIVLLIEAHRAKP